MVDATRKFVFDDGTTVILPLIKYGDVFASTVEGVYGGWISDRLLSAHQNGAILQWMVAHLPHLVWRINPYDPSLPASLGMLDPARIHREVTHVVDLRARSRNLWSGYSRGHKCNINKGKAAGVQVRVAETLDDVARYYAAYEDSLARWGSR